MAKEYKVLRPKFFGTGQMFTSIDRRTGRAVQLEYQRVEWEELGRAKDMQDAKRLHPIPVLELAEAV